MSTDTANSLKDGIPMDTVSKVEEILGVFQMDDKKLQDLFDKVMEHMRLGLEENPDQESSLKMLPTFVKDTPDGTEKGEFLALDLGGTNLRALHVKVEEKQLKVMGIKRCEITDEMKKAPGNKLFDKLAELLSKLINSDLKGKVLPLGFTFSFAFDQQAIDKGILIKWSKGFTCKDVEGKDVMELLKEAIERKGLQDSIRGIVVLNDTVGIMMSCCYEQQSCEIGMIIGTGTNACYMEEMRNVKCLKGEEGRMCINTEWGGFNDGDAGSLSNIWTCFDSEVDRTSENQGFHIFEKMISGKYLGDIAWLVMEKLWQEKLLFKGQTLQKQGQLLTEDISKIEQQEDGLENAKEILNKLDLKWDEVDLPVVRSICVAVSTRSAKLCGAALAAIISHMRKARNLDTLEISVAVDGTLYSKHPNFKKKLQETVHHLAKGCKITFFESEDGSGKGAAMATAVVQRLALQSQQ